MKRSVIGALALALATATAAYAQNTSTDTGSSANSSSSATQNNQSSSATPSSPSSSAAQSGQATPSTSATSSAQQTTAQQSDKQSDKQAHQTASTGGQGSEQFRWVAQMQQGGQEADQLQFQMLDQHIQMLGRSLEQIKRMADNPENNAAEIMRWSTMRDESAGHIMEAVTAFLSQRLIPLDMQQAMFSRGQQASQSQSQSQAQSSQSTTSTSPATSASATTQDGQQQAGVAGSQGDPKQNQSYNDLLQTAHEMLFQAHLAKQTSDDSHVQQLRQLADRLQREHQDAQRSLQARIRESGVLSQQGQSASRQQDQSSDSAAQGIDQSQSQQADRSNQNQSSQQGLNNSTSGSTTGSSGGSSSGAAGGGSSSGSTSGATSGGSSQGGSSGAQ